MAANLSRETWAKTPVLTESYSVGSCLAVDPKWHPGQNYNEGAWYINLDKEVPHVTAQTEGHLEGRKFICKIWIIPNTVRSRFLAVTFPHINSSKSSIARPFGHFYGQGKTTNIRLSKHELIAFDIANVLVFFLYFFVVNDRYFFTNIAFQLFNCSIQFWVNIFNSF